MVKNLTDMTCVTPADEQRAALPPVGRLPSPAVNNRAFHSPFSTGVVYIFVPFIGDSPKPNADKLSVVPKPEKPVLCFTEKICVLDNPPQECVTVLLAMSSVLISQ